MRRKYNIQDARRKIKQVFQYLKELNLVKTPPVVNAERYEWMFWLDTLPLHPTIMRGKDFTNLELLGVQTEPKQKSVDGDFIIKVSRPQETECPEPGVILKNWLKPGYANVGADPSTFVRPTLKLPGGKKGNFEDVAERVQALEDWTSRKRQWEMTEKKTFDALGAFEDLFDLYGKLQRESERYQIYAADGILVTKQDGHMVRHPILLQKIALDFNAGVPEFVLRDSEEPPEIYSSLLRFLGVDGATLKHIRQTLQDGHYHPFGGEETSSFLRDIVQSMWSSGKYYNNEIEAREASGSFLYRRPHIFLGLRTMGFAESIEKYIELIPQKQDFPESLLRVVGIDTGAGAERDQSETKAIDLLLAKSANPEQERVIHRLEETGAVLVQGPPGTGKSHTIANLIGHLLAQKKSILVTSHTSKALRVVREHVPKTLQSLCVAVLESDEDNNKQLEESVTGIVNYLSSTSTKKLESHIEKLKEKRDGLKKEYGDTREQLLMTLEEEYRALEGYEEKTLPSQAARWLLETAEQHGWIPGPISNRPTPPLNREELESLYAANAKISSGDETILESLLPEASKLPDPEMFAKHFDRLTTFKNREVQVGAEYWSGKDQDEATLRDLITKVEQAAEVFTMDQEWVRQFLEIGRQPDQQQRAWYELINLIKKSSEEIPEKEALVLSHGPQIDSQRPDTENLKICHDIVGHLEKGKKLKGLQRLLHRDWQEFLTSARVDSGKPSKPVHFQALINYMEIRSLRDTLVQRWTRQIEGLDHNPLEKINLGKQPEKKLRQVAEVIRKAVGWYKNQWEPVRQELIDCGFDWERFLKKTQSQKQEHSVLRATIENLLLPVLQARIEFVEWQGMEKTQDAWVEYLDSFSRKEASYALVKQLRSGIRRSDFDVYRQAWERFQYLEDLKEDHHQRKALLVKLRREASVWAETVEAREVPHHSGKLPGDPFAAWRHRLWEQLLEERAKLNLDRLQFQLNDLKEEIQDVTAQYVEKLSWLAQLNRTGLEQQQALNGWLALNKKMGRGTGKQVPELKEEAKKTLIKCREAVPVWIMPLSRAVESFDIATAQFDVVIIDEASQCDVLGLVAFALAKEVVVVGDHEQVSPYAVGFRTEQVSELIDEILVGIPNGKLYDAKSSVYDLARQSFGGTIRLVEHFRCVPDIIQFSNYLCYGNEIRPLREAAASQIRPALVVRQVENVRGEGDGKINQAEALEIVSLVLAMTRFKEYDNSTIGVISMVGTDQALYIDSLLRRRMTVSEYQKRRILCGSAAQFQGDERDIILLSMVNSPSADRKPLHLRITDDAKKVINVAASRARDQLWVVHSLDPARDLKVNDLRLKLIEHASNPEGLRIKEIEKAPRKLNSELERQIYKHLVEARFSVVIGCQVGEFIVDLVVVGPKGNRVAIQCDGDREINREKLEMALHRQMTLERLGWRFLRIRGSEFLRYPVESMKKIEERLKEFEIFPIGDLANDPQKQEAQNEAQAKELLKQVIDRARMIQSRWKDVPSVSSVIQRSVGTESSESKDQPDIPSLEVQRDEAQSEIPPVEV